MELTNKWEIAIAVSNLAIETKTYYPPNKMYSDTQFEID